jgi:hypothetical protein
LSFCSLLPSPALSFMVCLLTLFSRIVLFHGWYFLSFSSFCLVPSPLSCCLLLLVTLGWWHLSLGHAKPVPHCVHFDRGLMCFPQVTFPPLLRGSFCSKPQFFQHGGLPHIFSVLACRRLVANQLLPLPVNTTTRFHLPARTLFDRLACIFNQFPNTFDQSILHWACLNSLFTSSQATQCCCAAFSLGCFRTLIWLPRRMILLRVPLFCQPPPWYDFWMASTF